MRWALVLVLLIGIAIVWWPREEPPPALGFDWAATVSVLGEGDRFAEPHDIAIARDGTVYVADGADGNRIATVTPAGEMQVLAGRREAGFADGRGADARFNTPSGVAVDDEGVLYVADTANNAIRRVTPDGTVTTLATGLNGPMDVAVDHAGRIVVTDTYNDRLVAIDRAGAMSPLHLAVTLDTPTGIASGADGTLYIANTGNNLVHAVRGNVAVATIDALDAGGFERPIGVAVDSRGALYVSDERGRLFEVSFRESGPATRILAGGGRGYRNGRGPDAQFRRLTGVAVAQDGRLLVADAGNGLVRTVTATSLATATAPPSPRIAPDFDVAAFMETPLLWPLEPLIGPFEIAGTIGEARGADAGRFHAGIDVRADNGVPVLAVRAGVVTSPLATGEFGSLNEWFRLGDLTYVHMRAGRTHTGRLTDADRFVASRDERGRITRIRAKRGAHFQAGDIIGTVNQFNHVHLNVGWGGEEYNPLLFRLVQFEDTVAPTIARGGIQLFDAQGVAFTNRVKGRLQISGPVQVVVDAWDRSDGNRPNRRLGVYSLGYQVLQADGAPAPGFESPLETIRFDRLLSTPDATRFVYAPGSGIPFYGQRRTRFLYIVTNTFRDGIAAHGMWDTNQLAPGEYVLRVRVADITGNEATANRDLAVTIAGRRAAEGR